MFPCCSLETSHPRLLPQSPKVCSIHLCLKAFFYKSGELDTKTQKFIYKEEDPADAVGDLKVESFAPYSTAQSTNKVSFFFFFVNEVVRSLHI